MSIGPGPISPPGGREQTKVSTETEVHIPWKVAVGMGVVGNLAYLAGLLVYILIGWHYQGRWLWGFLCRNWRLLLVPLFAWWPTAPALLLLLRWGLEQWNRNWPPTYTGANPHEAGLMGPLWGIAQAWRTGMSSIKGNRYSRRERALEELKEMLREADGSER